MLRFGKDGIREPDNDGKAVLQGCTNSDQLTDKKEANL